MDLCSFKDVLSACDVLDWPNAKTIRLKVKGSVSLKTLKELEGYGILFKEASPEELKRAFDLGETKQLDPESIITLEVPRIVGEQVVAQDLADLLSIDSATSQTPKVYFLLSAGTPAKHFCYIGEPSLKEAPMLVKTYHDALKLWGILEGRADHIDEANALMFFGMRRVLINPGFGIADLSKDIPTEVEKISAFIANTDPQEARVEIFRSVLSEFLRDQPADGAFAYLLRTSKLFAQRLSEGLAIYLSTKSPEKLNQQAVAKHFELAEKLEKVISGMEAKSLTIPAAVLLAVKEVTFGGGWETLNTIILVSAALYLAAMTVAHFSQRAMLRLLKETIKKSTEDLQHQGLDKTNQVLTKSFKTLTTRRRNYSFGSWLMWVLSFGPLIAVIYAAFLASPPKPPKVEEPPMRIIPASSLQTDISSRNQERVELNAARRRIQ